MKPGEEIIPEYAKYVVTHNQFDKLPSIGEQSEDKSATGWTVGTDRSISGGKASCTGIELIAEERKRQIEKEGWTQEHDSKHFHGELAMAASAYAFPSNLICDNRIIEGINIKIKRKSLFPFEYWDKKWWKPTSDNRIKELVKAGALIAAEIDRLQHEHNKPKFI